MGNDASARDGAPGNEVGDDVYRALANRQRRLVLAFLLENERATVAELADVLAGRTAVSAEGPPTPLSGRRIEIGLHHRHVPILRTAGLVSYGDDAGEVTLGDVPEPVADRVSSLHRPEDDRNP